MKKYNFYAGPAILPQEVFTEASEAVKDYEGMGLSILEISHRSKEATEMLNEAHSLVRELLDLPEHFGVVFLQGGATTQFGMVPMNLLGSDETSGYVNTGNWSKKAISDAKIFGNVNVLADSSDKNFSYIPKGYSIPSGLKYIHITSNNTVRGTQFHNLPETNTPIVADMSSDIFSRPLDIERYGLIYAGAQKNMGPAGATLAILNTNFVKEPVRPVIQLMNYQNILSKESAYNTPPVFAIYVSMLNMRWIKANGGVKEMSKRNGAKASALYSEIDQNELFFGTTAEEDRSEMSVTFKLHDESLMDDFLSECAKANCIGLKGHRSVGGFRASIYNAMDIEGVNVLIDVMREFGKKKG